MNGKYSTIYWIHSIRIYGIYSIRIFLIHSKYKEPWEPGVPGVPRMQNGEQKP